MFYLSFSWIACEIRTQMEILSIAFERRVIQIQGTEVVPSGAVTSSRVCHAVHFIESNLLIKNKCDSSSHKPKIGQ